MRIVPLLLVACLSSSALVVRRPTLTLRRVSSLRHRGRAVIAKDGFDVSAQQFDLLALRSFRRDTILQYDATNQSEPLRIALTILGTLFSLCIPALAVDFRIDELTANVGAVVGTGISGGLFARNRAARQARMEKIEREYAMGDLRATYRGVRTSSLRGAPRHPSPCHPSVPPRHPSLRAAVCCPDVRGSPCSGQSNATSGAWWWWRATRPPSTRLWPRPSSTAAG